MYHGIMSSLSLPPLLMRTFGSLRVRNYRLYFSAQLVSMSGTWMQSVAQGWLVLRLTGSGVILGVTVALQFGPVLVLGPWGGLLADRIDKRRLMLVTQTAMAVLALALGAFTLAGAASVPLIWALAVLTGVCNAADNPARQSFVVEMVGREELANAVGLNSVIVNGSRLIGPAVAGVLIYTAGVAVCFLINGASFLVVIAALLAMRPAELRRSAPLARAKGQVRAGLAYAWRTPQLRVPLLMMAVVSTLGYNFSVLMPLLAQDVFHRGGGTYGALSAAMGAGALAGALFAAARARPTRLLLVGATLAFGCFTMLIGAAPSLTGAFLLLVPMGAAAILFVATVNSLLQLNSAAAMRGRVMALWAVLFLGSTPIGGPLTGWIAGVVGVRWTFVAAGAATLLTACAAAVALRRQTWRVGAHELAAAMPDDPACAHPAPLPVTRPPRRMAWQLRHRRRRR